MRKTSSIQHFASVAVVVAVLSPLSLFAEDRREPVTPGTEMDVYHRTGDLEGIVVSVTDDGDDFELRTGNGVVLVRARGGVRVHYRGERFWIRDLERGDRVAVDLDSRSEGYRARSVEVLESASHRGDDRYRDDERHGKRSIRLEGRVVAFDRQRDVLILRTFSSGEVEVETGRLERKYGRGWSRRLRRGDPVEIRARVIGGRVVATDIDAIDRDDRW